MRFHRLKALLLSLLAVAAVGSASATVLTDVNIGSYPGPSTASYNSQTGYYTVTIYGTSSENNSYRNFDYTSITGNFTVTTELVNLPAVAGGSSQVVQSGLMVRNSVPGKTLSGTSYETSALFTSTAGGITPSYDSCSGSTCSSSYAASVSSSSPMYVRLTRVGNQFTDYWSTDGSTWNAIATQTLNMSSTAYVGLLSMADTQATATFNYYNLNGIPAASVSAPGVTVLLTLAAALSLGLRRKIALS